MAENEKSLSERMADIEDKIDYIIYSGKPKYEPEFSEREFYTFYSRIEKVFEKSGAIGGTISMNSRFENILKHKVLYPDYENGWWYPIGKTTKNIPIDFRNMKYDYAVDMLNAGNFSESAKGE